MNDFEFLLLLLACFYVWECLYWIRRPGVAFRSWFGIGWNLNLPTGGLSNRFGGFLLAMPLPSFGEFFAVQGPGLILTETELIAHPDPLDLYDEAPTKSERQIAFDQIESIRSKRHHVLINGKKFITVSSSAIAELLVARIKKLKSETPEERAAMEATRWKESLDTHAIRKSLETLRGSVRLLGFLCTLLFAHVAVVVPWIGLNYTLSSTWPMLVGVLVFLNTAIAIQFCRMHRRVYPAASDERFQHTLTMSLYPLASVRATETLARPLLEDFHPLAVAKGLLNEDAFDSFASRHLRRLIVRVQSTADESQRNGFKKMEAATREFLKREKINIENLLARPKAGDSSCRSFCPRCGSQFTFEQGKCSDCGSVSVDCLCRQC